MTCDARPGQPYSPMIPFLDANGAPVTGATTGTKIMTVTGPAGSSTNGGVTHRGGGLWGLDLPATATATAGTYRATLDQITSGAYTMLNATMTFDVGYDNAWNLREVYTHVRQALRDGETGQTTASGSTTTAVDAKRYKRGSVNQWLGSELLFLDPVSVTDDNPVIVTAFDPTTGTFTFANNTVTSTVSGLRFIIGNFGGRGWSHDEVLNAIRLAVRRTGRGAMLLDETTTYNTTTSEYAIPTTFGDVTELAYQVPGARTGDWSPIAKRFWEYQADRRRIVFTRSNSQVYTSFTNPSRWGLGYAIPNAAKLRMRGHAVPQLPTLFGEPVDANGERVRDLALLDLLMQRSDQDGRQRAAMIAGQLGRPAVRLPGS